MSWMLSGVRNTTGGSAAARVKIAGRFTAAAGLPATASEERLLLRAGAGVGRIEPEVTIRLGGGDASARSALEESVLDEERLIHFLERARVLADGGGYCADADRSALELLDDGLEDSRVHVVEPELIDLEQLQRVGGDLAIDFPAGLHLGEVADASQQPVGDARRAARSFGDLLRAVLVDVDLHHLGGAVDDLLEVGGGIEVEPHLDPEPRTHRRSEHAESGGGADQGELLDGHGDRLRLGSFGEADVDLVVLHRRVQELFDDRLEPVDLVDEEDVAFAEIC